jgi:hypothetical protein
VAAAALILPAAAQVPARAAPEGPDWPAFLARQDAIWNRLPARWEEGAFIGNGLLGAMIFSDDGRGLSWQLGRTDVVDHRPIVDPILASPRLPIGRLRIDTDASIDGFEARLDLWNAELTGTFTTPRGGIAFRTYAHAREPVVVIELGGGAAASTLRVGFRPDVAIIERHLFRKTPLAEGDLNPAPFVERFGDTFVSVQQRTSGGEYAVAWRELPGGDGGRRILASVADSHPDAGARRLAAEAVDRAAGQDAEALRRPHRAFWHAYYPASFVALPDARLESFYWLQMYKLASATRADRLPIDNQGPWYRRTPWPALWWNLNVQLSYWPVYDANRLEIGDSLLRFLDDRRAVLRKNAPAAPPEAGEVMAIGRMSGPDAVSPVGFVGPWTPKNGAQEISNLVWVMHNVWLHWRRTMDDRLARDLLFPLLRASVSAVLQRVERRPDGVWHLPETISPEFPKTAPDTNYDLSLLRWGCQTLLDLDARLRVGDAMTPVWREALQRLAPYPQGADGYMVGRGVPFDASHRHFSHLLMIYPLKTVIGETPDERALIERSLAHWIGFEGALQGYSFVGASLISSLLGKGDDAVKYLDALIGRFVHPNTMYTESGPVIETPLAAAQAIHEMLIQSHGGTIRVFPALPAAWHDVAFANLRAEGGFLVTAVRRGGRVTRVRLESVAGEPTRLRVDLDKPAVSGSGSARVKAERPGLWRVTLRAGESVELALPGAAAAERALPVIPATAAPHPFGLK